MGCKCKDCGEEFDYISDLGSHLIYAEGEGVVRENDDGDYVFECVKCGETYKDEGDLHMHLIFGEKFGELTGKDKEEQDEFERNPPEEFRELIEEIRRKNHA